VDENWNLLVNWIHLQKQITLSVAQVLFTTLILAQKFNSVTSSAIVEVKKNMAIKIINSRKQDFTADLLSSSAECMWL
jgi:hypothetical protein